MNRSIKAKLCTLPYREMRELSKDIIHELPDCVGEEEMAERLSSLADMEDCEAATKEQEMLHSMFTRKKQITVLPYDNGFKISIPAQNIDVYCSDVRDGISQALDNLVALKALG